MKEAANQAMHTITYTMTVGINHSLGNMHVSKYSVIFLLCIIVLSFQVLLISGQLESQASNPRHIGSITSTHKTREESDYVVVCITTIVLEIILIVIMMYFIIRARVALTQPRLAPVEKKQIQEGYIKRHENPDNKWYAP
jgi:hypothetical protein